MPTLMASQTTSPAVGLESTSCSAPHGTASAATGITLSFNGVDFKLCPMDDDSEMSCKTKSDSVVLTLTSFTGTLTVLSNAMLSSLSSSVKPVAAAATASTTPTVEDDPDSPEQQKKKSRQNISPRQKTLPFKTEIKNKKKTTKTSKKKDASDEKETNRKRAGAEISLIPREISPKRSCGVMDSSLPPISLGQASQSQPTQLTQIDTDADHFNNDTSAAPSIGEPDIQTNTNTTESLPTSTSVQDILDRDRIQSSGDSVATIKDSDDCGIEISDGDIAATVGVDMEDKNISEEITIPDATDSETVAAGSGAFSYPAPPARWGHTMTQVENGQILVYGGQSFDLDGNPVILSDVHVYDPKNEGSWHKPINCRGEARQWHTATYIPGRQQIIAFGGETIDPIRKKGIKKDKVITSDTLRVLDTEIMLWYPPAASGDVPTGRSGHTATFFPSTNELILFGGVRGSKWLNTVSVLDVTRWIWTTPHIIGTAPKPRSYHSATAVGAQKLVVFGGNNKTSCFNTVHVLEAIAEGSGDGINHGSEGGYGSSGWKWSNPTIRGKAPFPRTGHVATLLEDGKTIIVYGGWDPNEEDELTGEDNIFRGSYLLDTQEWTWKKGPDPLSGGSGSANHVVEDCGAKRCGHTAALNSENGEVFVFGGRIPGEVLAGDVQRLVPPQEKTVQLEGC